MRLYLVRHGKYLTPDKDREKSLSPEGISQTKTMAGFLKRKKQKVDLIWHSNKKRAVQTAQILSGSLGKIKVIARADLGPADSVNRFLELVNELNKDLMIVGHNPFLQKLATQLLGVNHFESLHLPNSGLICLDKKEAWKLVFSINPDLITSSKKSF